MELCTEPREGQRTCRTGELTIVNSPAVPIAAHTPALAPKRKSGPPKNPHKLIFKSVGMREEDWEYLALWGPGVDSTNGVPHNPTTQLGGLIERTRAMAPSGPGAFGHPIDPEAARQEKTTPAISRYAKAHGMTKAQMLNRMWRAFQAAESASGEGEEK